MITLWSTGLLAVIAGWGLVIFASERETMSLAYILNQLGEDREAYAGAVAPPIYQSSNFAYDSVAAMRAGIKDELTHYFYTRGNNPTVELLRQKLAALEGTEDALVFSSGSGAIAAAIMSQLSQGSHVVCVDKPYSWTDHLLQSLLPRFGVSITMVDGTDAANFQKAIRPETQLFVLESPNSVTFEQQDLAAVAEIAKQHGITTLIDNSYASPVFQQPANYGIDIICHSATKYLNGHSDVVAGVVCGSQKMIQQIFAETYMTLGAVLSPHDAWLMIRGLRTLDVRMQRVADTTEALLPFLENHPAVDKVYHPFASGNPQYPLATKQLKRGGGQFSITLHTDHVSVIERFCEQLKHFLLACSWGGYESLVFPTCAVIDTKAEAKPGIPWNLVRFYIGLEDRTELQADLKQALDGLLENDGSQASVAN